jgi:cytochrome c553
MRSIFIAFGASLLMVATVHAQEPNSDRGTVQRAIHVCAACHGEQGRSDAPVYPRLAGQMPLYTIAQLRDFRAQTRAESDWQAYMWGIAALLDDETIAGLAAYYAEQKPAAGKPGIAKLVEAGRKIYEQGVSARSARLCLLPWRKRGGCLGLSASGRAARRVCCTATQGVPRAAAAASWRHHGGRKSQPEQRRTACRGAVRPVSLS